MCRPLNGSRVARCGGRSSERSTTTEAVVQSMRPRWDRTSNWVLSAVCSMLLAAVAALIYWLIPTKTVLATIVVNVCLLGAIAGVLAGFLIVTDKADGWIARLVARHNDRILRQARRIECRPMESSEVVAPRINQRATESPRWAPPAGLCQPQAPKPYEMPRCSSLTPGYDRLLLTGRHRWIGQ